MAAALKQYEPVEDKIDRFRFWTFEDLKARRIVGSRTDLHRKQRFYGFPKSIHWMEGRRPAAVFHAMAVMAWVEARMKEQEAAE